MVEELLKERKATITGKIFDHIQQQIREGIWKVGEKIPSEPTLVKELGVSRSAIREVLQQYAALGIIESQQGKGTFLRSADLDRLMSYSPRVEHLEALPTLEEVLNYRLITEVSSVQMLMKQRKPILNEAILKLEQINLKMHQALNNTDAFISLDNQFHTLIADFCGNSVFAVNLKNLIDRMRSQQRKLNSMLGFKDALVFHDRLIEAMKQGNLQEALKAMQDHLIYGLNKLKEYEKASKRKINTKTGTSALQV